MAPMTPKPSADGSEGAEQPQDAGPVGHGEYLVKEGECVSSIAKDTGLFWETIWNEPANADLRSVRGDPNVLLPGDRLTIPALRGKQVEIGTGAFHRFVRRGEPVKLRLRICENDVPRANEPFELVIDGESRQGTTDADGRLEAFLPGNVRDAVLYLGPPENRTEYDIKLRELSPVSELVGVQQRLNNLGFACGAEDGQSGPETDQAIYEFQDKHDLQATGQPDDATRAKLREVHGS